MATPKPSYIATLVIQRVDYEMKPTSGDRGRMVEIKTRLEPMELARIATHADSLTTLKTQLNGHIGLIADHGE